MQRSGSSTPPVPRRLTWPCRQTAQDAPSESPGCSPKFPVNSGGQNRCGVSSSSQTPPSAPQRLQEPPHPTPVTTTPSHSIDRSSALPLTEQHIRMIAQRRRQRKRSHAAESHSRIGQLCHTLADRCNQPTSVQRYVHIASMDDPHRLDACSHLADLCRLRAGRLGRVPTQPDAAAF